MTHICRLLVSLLILGVFGGFAFGQEVKPGADSPLHRGNPSAEFKIEVFYDYQCPSCVPFHQKLTQVLAKYPDRVSVTIRNFPLAMHDKALFAAKVVEAARLQGKGFEMAETLLDKQVKWANDPQAEKRFVQYAVKLGLNKQQFKQDVQAQQLVERITLDVERAKSLELNYVPSVILNGKHLSFVEALELEEVILKGN